ncbi:MAG: hypothetical protein VXY23_00250 [Pseudomonadota bacterium]|nr:hypothetical protein [Pseudomonadota bacterium]
MFEHKSLDGDKHRVLPAWEAFVKEEVLETREPKNGEGLDAAGRHQHGVVGETLVERFLPPETVGNAWSYDAHTPWWVVVVNPPHAGIVADFSKAKGGLYRHKWVKERNVVAFAEGGEEIVLEGAEYAVTRAADGQELRAPSLMKLRAAYYAG